jgi:fimbrial chaperone protein
MHVLFRRATLPFCALGLVWCAAEAVHAANFAFSPTSLELTVKERSGTVTLQNPGDKPVRFEAIAMRWDQRADGQMDLHPTEDLLVYPPLITVAPDKSSKFRVTVLVPPGEREKTYRIQVTEIPAFRGVNQAGGASVTIRSQVVLPVFFAPAAAKQAIATIVNPATRAGTFTFSIADAGTVRVHVRSVAVTGIGTGGRTIFQKSLDGWYVLAGGHRDYSVPLPRDTCAQVRAISVDALTVPSSHITQTIEVPADACRG